MQFVHYHLQFYFHCMKLLVQHEYTFIPLVEKEKRFPVVTIFRIRPIKNMIARDKVYFSLSFFVVVDVALLFL